MADKSAIDWCTASLNPFGWGCYGPGGTPQAPRVCENCYAHAMSTGPYPRCKECAEFVPHWHPEDLDKARSWKKSREIFWQSMGDMWHPCSSATNILEVLVAANETPQHTHLFLTKNPSRYLDFTAYMPKENAYYGVTIRNQAEANRFMPVILALSARGFKVYLSLEPLYERVEFLMLALYHLDKQLINGVHQVILGGENGRSARHPMNPEWVRCIRDACSMINIPFFFKGHGQWKIAETIEQANEYTRNLKTPKICQLPGSSLVYYNIGKKLAGRELDGREHNALAWRPNV
jgi:protein gp37